MKQLKFKGFEIEKSLIVNSGHVTFDDYKLLKRGGDFAVYHDEFHIRVHLGEEVLEEAKATGMSEYFIKLVKTAKKAGCQWLTLDGDGPTNPDFETFDW